MSPLSVDIPGLLDSYENAEKLNHNVLDGYDLSTYHLKLYVANFIGKDLDNIVPTRENSRIIAESAQTLIGIEDLEFETFWGYQATTYSSVATIFKFTLREPLGSSLLDQIRMLADELGIENFIKMPFFLEISFRARDKKDGSPISPIFLPVIRYPIHILKMTIDIDKGGSIYTCEAVKVHDYAHTAPHGVFNASVTPEVADLTSAMKAIEDILNNNESQSKEQYEGGARDNIHKEVYKINVDPDIAAKGEFFNNADKEKSSRNDPYLTWDNNKTTLHITPGLEIGNVIDSLMANTKWLQYNLMEAKLKRAYKIISTITLIDYDATRNDYVREIVLNIVPVAVRPLINETGEIKERTLAEDAVGRPFEEGNGYVAKSYHYIFTGKNIHVLNFDFKINLAWYTMLQPQGGRSRTSRDSGTLTDVPGEWYNLTNLMGAPQSPKVIVPFKVDETLYPPSSEYPKRTEGNIGGIFPTSIFLGPTVKNNANIIEADRDSKASRTAMSFKNYIEESRTEFITADVEIRGDPFWLTAEDTQIIYFIFVLGLPQEMETNTGLIPIPTDTHITGLFQILTVKNSFSKGLFKQTLKGRRDPITRITRTVTKSIIDPKSDGFVPPPPPPVG